MNQEINHSSLDQSARMLRIQKDIRNAISEYPRESTGIKIMAEKVGLNEKTLKRILKGTHSPTIKTVIKIYRYLTGTLNDKDTVMAMPKVFENFVSSQHDNFILSKDQNVTFSKDIDSLIENDSIFRFIYIETATGNLTKSLVGYEYGKGGLRVLEKMLEKNVIKEIEPELYTSSTNRGTLPIETSFELGRFLIENKFNTEKCRLMGENICSVYFEGVTREAYNELLVVDWEAAQRKKEILKDKRNNGDIKYWSAQYTDTLSKNLIYDEAPEVLQ